MINIRFFDLTNFYSFNQGSKFFENNNLYKIELELSKLYFFI